ncbi:S8 family serine peptidase [Aquimarina agarivorans]|uniref:S8 family serine peptidase n=1 Tax=Aquimarina agarivorans TaxID=980584 RepID=UPI000248F908|nr:S8 family serine peptidase [Aquimarina agarivorans]
MIKINKTPKLAFTLWGSVALLIGYSSVCAQQSNESDLYYYTNQGKVSLTVDKDFYILNAKDKRAFKKQCDILATKKNAQITNVSRLGFMVYQSDKTGNSEKDVINQMHLKEKNWDIHTALVTDNGAKKYPTGKVLLKMKEGKSFDMLNDLLKECNISKIDSPRKNVYTISMAKASESISLANKIYESNLVEFSQPDFLVKIILNNDPLFNEQYSLHNTGQTVKGSRGISGIDCSALEAWEITTGSPSVRVAVIDQGVEAHPDLNDGNGMSKVVAGFTPETANGDGTPTNFQSFHGMAVAGTIAASHNNIGLRGIAPNVQLLSGNFSTASTVESLASIFTWAKDNDADVINCSWSFDSSTTDCSRTEPALNDAIEDAARNGRDGKGITIVFSSGNRRGTANCVSYPANLSSQSLVLAVGAADSSGNIASYSQAGPELDLVGISAANFSTTANLGNVHALDRAGAPGIDFLQGDYIDNFGGTSYSAAIVSGIAALMYSVNPELTATQVRDILTSTAEDFGPRGFDNNFGHGNVNAHQAVLAAQRLANTSPVVTPPTPNQAPTLNFVGLTNNQSFTAPANLTITVNANDTDGRIVNVRLFLNNRLVRQESIAPYEWGLSNQNDPNIKNLSQGTYTLRAVATDNDGATSEQSITLRVNNAAPVAISNVALNKSATQSSTAFGGAASRAVDGNTNGNYREGSVTHTRSERSWWRVDLGATYNISSISVFNRTNNCCSARLNSTIVYAGLTNSTNPSDFTQIGNLNQNAEQSFSNINQQARYVLIAKTNSDFLSLAEVQVFGSLATTLNSTITAEATLYRHCNFNGTSARLAVGDYADISSVFINNQLSSIQIPSGLQVTLYSEVTFGGSSIVLTANDSCLSNDRFNDVASSARISRTTGAKLLTEQDSFAKVTVFPNPASEVINLDISNYQDTGVNFAIYNTSGLLITQGAFTIDHNNIEPITVSNLANGLYFITVNALDKEQKTSIKFIKE